MDTMIHKLEKYADNLESIVQQRTAELYDEKQKTDMLLNRMLPPYESHFLTTTRGDSMGVNKGRQGRHKGIKYLPNSLSHNTNIRGSFHDEVTL